MEELCVEQDLALGTKCNFKLLGIELPVVEVILGNHCIHLILIFNQGFVLISEVLDAKDIPKITE